MINAGIRLNVNVQLAGIKVESRTRADAHAGRDGASAQAATRNEVHYARRPRPQEPAQPARRPQPQPQPRPDYGEPARTGLDRAAERVYAETRPARQQGEAAARQALADGTAAARPAGEAAGKAVTATGEAFAEAYGEATEATRPEQDAVVEAAWIGARAAADTYRTASQYAHRRGEDVDAAKREASRRAEAATAPAREEAKAAGEAAGRGLERMARAGAEVVAGAGGALNPVHPEVLAEATAGGEADVSPQGLQAAQESATRVDIRI